MQLDPEKGLYVLEVDELKAFEPISMPLEWPITESEQLFKLIWDKMQEVVADMGPTLQGVALDGIELVREYQKTQVILNNMMETVLPVLRVMQILPPTEL